MAVICVLKKLGQHYDGYPVVKKSLGTESKKMSTNYLLFIYCWMAICLILSVLHFYLKIKKKKKIADIILYLILGSMMGMLMAVYDLIGKM